MIDGVLSVVGICITVIVANKKSAQRNEERMDKLEEKVDKIGEHSEEQYLSILRLTIMSENMPIAERIIAGKKYVDKGGNGEVKKYYQQMLDEHTF